MSDLPDFDTLMKLHQQDPEALERLRQKLTDELFEHASDDTRRRLAGLQFRINMELRRAGNPTARCVKLSGMMQEAFDELNFCLNNPPAAIQARQKPFEADIVPLTPRSADKGHPGKH